MPVMKFFVCLLPYVIRKNAVSYSLPDRFFIKEAPK